MAPRIASQYKILRKQRELIRHILDDLQVLTDTVEFCDDLSNDDLPMLIRSFETHYRDELRKHGLP